MLVTPGSERVKEKKTTKVTGRAFKTKLTGRKK